MNIAILLVSRTGEKRRTSLTSSWFKTLSSQVQAYFRQQSGGRVECRFVVFEWLELSITSEQWWKAGPSVGDEVRKQAAIAYGFDEHQFDRYIIVIDDLTSRLGVTDYKTDTRIAAIDATPALVAHELGHAFGAHHTKLETPDGPSEYDGPFCVMGREGGKYSWFDRNLDTMDINANHSASGPGMCVVSLSQTGWLDIGTHCKHVASRHDGTVSSTARIAALNGAPTPGANTLVGCIVDSYDRFVIEYRSSQVFWDQGLAGHVPSANGWLVVYRSPLEGALDALQVASIAVSVGATLKIDTQGYYPFGGGPLSMSILRVDSSSRSVEFRVERRVGKAPQHERTEEILDYLQWPILASKNPLKDEGLDQLAIALNQLRELKRLRRLSGPRLEGELGHAVDEQIAKVQQFASQLTQSSSAK